MEWTDDAIVLSTRRYGETGAVATLLTREHGRHGGLVHGGAGKAGRAALQAGNRLAVTWRGRLPEQLGRFSWEATKAYGASWFGDADRLAAISAACAMAEVALPEREIHRATFEGLAGFLESLDDADWPSLYVHWEIGLLAEAGFELDLTRCARSGRTDDLAYVSPRSGRAVNRDAAEGYRDRLLPLPTFVRDRTAGDAAEVLAGLRLTGYFIEKYLLSPQARAIPAARSRLVERLQA